MNVRVFAPAKINLTLEVGPPRADGRHPLRSVAAFADIGDWVAARASDDLTLTVSGPFASDLEAEADNLVLRAARALAHKVGVSPKAHLHLEKNLPVASGMGGGSSDAAAALKALNDLWSLGLSEPELAAIAAPLGADVPVCVGARAALMLGAGERYAPFQIPRFDAVLVNPGEHLPTGAVYRRFDEMGLGADFVDGDDAGDWRDPFLAMRTMRARGNALEAPAMSMCETLADVAHLLSAGEGVRHVAMTGSGATMFAITDDRGGAEALVRDIAEARPHWWVQAARLGGAL